MTKNGHKNIQENKAEFIKMIQDQLSKMGSSSSSNQPIDRIVPDSPTSNFRINTLSHDSDIN